MPGRQANPGIVAVPASPRQRLRKPRQFVLVREGSDGAGADAVASARQYPRMSDCGLAGLPRSMRIDLIRSVRVGAEHCRGGDIGTSNRIFSIGGRTYAIAALSNTVCSIRGGAGKTTEWQYGPVGHNKLHTGCGYDFSSLRLLQDRVRNLGQARRDQCEGDILAYDIHGPPAIGRAVRSR